MFVWFAFYTWMCIMTKETTFKSKPSNFFDEERDLSGLIPFHKWLLISASVLIFVVLPLLFIWSSLGIIHQPVYGQYRVLTDAEHVDQTMPSFKPLVIQPLK